MNPEAYTVIDHQPYQHYERYDEINHPAQCSAGRYYQPGEIDLFDHISCRDHGMAALGQGIGKELPGEKRGERHHRIGGPFAGEFGQLSKDYREDDHGQKGLQHGPQDTENGLFVPDQHIPPGQKAEQFPIAPKLGKVDVDKTFARADDAFRSTL